MNKKTYYPRNSDVQYLNGKYVKFGDSYRGYTVWKDICRSSRATNKSVLSDNLDQRNARFAKIYKKYKNRILLYLVFLASLIIFLPQKVRADAFYPRGDTMNCEFAQTISVSYRNLPVPSRSAGSMYYDSSLIHGESDGFVGSHDFFDVGTVLYPSARRYLGVADAVQVPPNSNIDFGYFYFNYSSHQIDVGKSNIFVSRADPSSGDLTRLGADVVNVSVAFLFNGSMITRGGKAHVMETIGNFAPSSYSYPPVGRTIYSFSTIQPLKIVHRSVVPEFNDSGELILEFSSTLFNYSSYTLNNIEVTDQLPDGSIHTQVVSIGPKDRISLYYDLNMGLDYPLDMTISPLIVKDPNFHKESVSLAASTNMSTNPESRSIISLRGDYGAPSTWVANQTDFVAVGSGDFISVTLIPYELRSMAIDLHLAPDLSVEKFVSDSDETMVESTTSNSGEFIRYDIIVKNNGARAENIDVNDLFSDNYIEITDANFFNIQDLSLQAHIGRINNKQEVHYVLDAKVKSDLISGEYVIPNVVNLFCDSDYCQNISDSVSTIVNVYSEEIPSQEGDISDGAFNPSTICNLGAICHSGYLARTGSNINIILLSSSFSLYILARRLNIGRYLSRILSAVIIRA
ncbi:hypothetical protein JW887_05625 [Candidatus Dojkabacteria bacterium]|nr:hypothetical protein [Candidatus Dojkabacteria bacterium]